MSGHILHQAGSTDTSNGQEEQDGQPVSTFDGLWKAKLVEQCFVRAYKIDGETRGHFGRWYLNFRTQ